MIGLKKSWRQKRPKLCVVSVAGVAEINNSLCICIYL